VEESQGLSGAGDGQFQVALDPSQTKAEPITSVASVNTSLRKDRNHQRGENMETTREQREEKGIREKQQENTQVRGAGGAPWQSRYA